MQQNQTCFHHDDDARSSVHITFISPNPSTIIIIRILKSEKEMHIVLPRLMSYQWYHQCLVEKVNLTITIVTIMRFNFYPPEPKDEVQTGIGTPATTSCCPHHPSRAGRQGKMLAKCSLAISATTTINCHHRHQFELLHFLVGGEKRCGWSRVNRNLMLMSFELSIVFITCSICLYHVHDQSFLHKPEP